MTTSCWRSNTSHKSAFSRLIGSYATIARLLDDFVIGVEQFGQRIQPLMRSRRNLAASRSISVVIPSAARDLLAAPIKDPSLKRGGYPRDSG